MSSFEIQNFKLLACFVAVLCLDVVRNLRDRLSSDKAHMLYFQDVINMQ